MPRKVSVKELTKMLASGASIDMPDDPPMVVEGLTEVLDQLRELAEAQQQIAQDQSSAITDAVDNLTDALANFKGGTVDMKPLERLIEQLKTPPLVERPNYRFNVQRNTRGFITGMTVAPEKPTLN